MRATEGVWVTSIPRTDRGRNVLDGVAAWLTKDTGPWQDRTAYLAGLIDRIEETGRGRFGELPINICIHIYSFFSFKRQDYDEKVYICIYF